MSDRPRKSSRTLNDQYPFLPLRWQRICWRFASYWAVFASHHPIVQSLARCSYLKFGHQRWMRGLLAAWTAYSEDSHIHQDQIRMQHGYFWLKLDLRDRCYLTSSWRLILKHDDHHTLFRPTGLCILRGIYTGKADDFQALVKRAILVVRTLGSPIKIS